MDIRPHKQVDSLQINTINVLPKRELLQEIDVDDDDRTSAKLHQEKLMELKIYGIHKET